MNPVTGPFTRYIGDSSEMYYRYVDEYYKQVKPYDLPLKFRQRTGQVYAKLYPGVNAGSYAGAFANEASLKKEAYSKAYAKLVDALGDSASLGALLAERRQSIGMLTDRVSQLYRFARHLRHGNLVAALGVLGTPSQRWPRNHAHSRHLASQWLELHFGWVPLVNDIQNAMTVLDRPIPQGVLRGKGSSSVQITRNPPRPYDPDNLVYEEFGFTRSEVAHATVGCTARMTNPNLALASSLGLLDPFAVLYEITPWSFVFDWVSNASQYLGAWSDFVGYTLTDSFVTYKLDRFELNYSNLPAQRPPGSGRYGTLERSLGIPYPQFHWKPLRLSVTRAATAMSLLIQQLPGRSSRTS